MDAVVAGEDLVVVREALVAELVFASGTCATVNSAAEIDDIAIPSLIVGVECEAGRAAESSQRAQARGIVQWLRLQPVEWPLCQVLLQPQQNW